MNSSYQPIEALIDQAIQTGIFPAVSLIVAQSGQIKYEAQRGFAQLLPERTLTSNHVFDIASLTKPMATATLMMLATQENKLSPTLPLTQFFASKTLSSVTLAHLLNHTSGLPDWKPYYQELINLPASKRLKACIQKILTEPLVYPSGTQCLYSDLGYILLGHVLELVYQKNLDELFDQKIAKPLGLKSTYYLPLDQKSKPETYIVATEECTWRNKLLVGEVMDDNAWALNGVAGHAGLFATAQDIHLWLKELRESHKGNSSFIVQDTFDLFTRIPKNRDLKNIFFTYGFDTPSQPSSSGQYFSPHSLGHLGYSGTSFWWDLDRDLWVILLTNRVHPTRHNDLIKEFRPKLHDLVMTHLLK